MMKTTFVFLFFFLAIAATYAAELPPMKDMKALGEHNTDEVGDFQFYQGPLTNIIKTLQDLLKRPRKP